MCVTHHRVALLACVPAFMASCSSSMSSDTLDLDTWTDGVHVGG